LGAGFGSIASIPNTAALLAEVHHLAETNVSWGVSKDLEGRLTDAYAFFYPDKGEGFRPSVVDFFSVLSSYGQIDRGNLPDGFPDRELLADLRFAIVHVICERLRVLDDQVLQRPHGLLDEMIAPGNIVVTTNWDTVLERIAHARGVPHRLSGLPSDSELLVLKLHGSIDWLLRGQAKKAVAKTTYADLSELLASARAPARNVVSSQVLRTRVSNPGASWRTIKGATRDPFMLTMSPGKSEALGPLIALWESAYRAISAARALEIVGYSMPEDDIEIRTLLRAGVRRGPQDPDITIRNPAPDVHARLRALIHHEAESDYTPVPVLAS
jgi:hypothetical protein